MVQRSMTFSVVCSDIYYFIIFFFCRPGIKCKIGSQRCAVTEGIDQCMILQVCSTFQVFNVWLFWCINWYFESKTIELITTLYIMHMQASHIVHFDIIYMHVKVV